MARKKDSRRRDRSKTLQQRKRTVKAKKAAAFGAFYGNVESLEKRELLAGDTFEALDHTSAEVGTLDASSLEIVAPVRGEGVLAAPPPVHQASFNDLNSTSTVVISDASTKSLDVSGISNDLIVTVKKGGGNNNTISVQKMAANGSGTGGTATYAIQDDGGSLTNLVAGRQGQKVKIVLDGELDLLEVTKAGDLQFAIGHKTTKASLLTKSTWVQVVKKSKGDIDTLEIGKSGDSNDVELIVGKDIHINTLKKGGSFNGRLVLHYPDKTTSSRPAKLVDLSLTPPRLTGFGSLDQFSAASIKSVQTGDGPQELKAGDQAISVFSGDGNDILLGDANAQTLDGQAGKDVVRGNAGNDTLRGGDDADQLSGGLGNDTLEGGDGDDVYSFGKQGVTAENRWGTDSITDTVGKNTLDFSQIPAQLDVSINGDAVTVKSTKEIATTSGLSFGSDADGVTLALSSGDVPTAVVTDRAVASVSATSFAAQMIVGSATKQINVSSPSVSDVETRINQIADATVTTNVDVSNVASQLKIEAGALAIAVKDGTGDWEFAAAGTSVALSNLFSAPEQDAASAGKAVTDATNVWTVPSKKLKLAIGAFEADETAKFEAASFEVTFFGESAWTGGYIGNQSSLEDAITAYYVASVEPLIESAASRAQIVGDPARVNEITKELWLNSITNEIQTKFTPAGNVNIEVLPRDAGKVLSVSIDDHTGDIAIAPTTVTLPTSLSTSMPEQKVSGTAAISRFVAPSNDNAQVIYDIQSLTRDLTIEFNGTEAKSTLDVSNLTGEMRVGFSGPGEVEIEVGARNSRPVESPRSLWVTERKHTCCPKKAEKDKWSSEMWGPPASGIWYLETALPEPRLSSTTTLRPLWSVAPLMQLTRWSSITWISRRRA